MERLSPCSWTVGERTYSVAVFVDRGEVVKVTLVEGNRPIAVSMIPTRTESTIILAKPGDERKYLGDRMGSMIGRLTGRKPCAGCKSVESGINAVHRKVANAGRRAREILIHG